MTIITVIILKYVIIKKNDKIEIDNDKMQLPIIINKLPDSSYTHFNQ